MAANPDQRTVDACIAAIRGAVDAGLLTFQPQPPTGQPHQPALGHRQPPPPPSHPPSPPPSPPSPPPPPPVPPANDVREHHDALIAHGMLRVFTVAMNDVETAKARTIESKRNMFIYVDELLKKHTIPIVDIYGVTFVQRLWMECGWRGHVIYPTEPADFLPQGQPHSTLEAVTAMVRRSNIFPLSVVDLGHYDRPELIATHQTLTLYGHWCAEVNRHLHEETIRETQYRDAGLRLFSQTTLPVVNEADVLSVMRLRVEFGCILPPLYPRDCTDYTNVEQHQHVRERAEFHGFWIHM